MANPPDRPRLTRKAYGYITRGTDVLLLVDLAGALAGARQIPGGTLEPGESPEAAVLRECFEETGLTGLQIAQYLGVRECPCPVHEDEWQERHYFHLIADPAPSATTWKHLEATPSDGSPPIPLQLSFVPLDGSSLDCLGDWGYFLPALAASLLPAREP